MPGAGGAPDRLELRAQPRDRGELRREDRDVRRRRRGVAAVAARGWSTPSTGSTSSAARSEIDRLNEPRVRNQSHNQTDELPEALGRPYAVGANLAFQARGLGRARWIRRDLLGRRRRHRLLPASAGRRLHDRLRPGRRRALPAARRSPRHRAAALRLRARRGAAGRQARRPRARGRTAPHPLAVPRDGDRTPRGRVTGDARRPSRAPAVRASARRSSPAASSSWSTARRRRRGPLRHPEVGGDRVPPGTPASSPPAGRLSGSMPRQSLPMSSCARSVLPGWKRPMRTSRKSCSSRLRLNAAGAAGQVEGAIDDLEALRDRRSSASRRGGPASPRAARRPPTRASCCSMQRVGGVERDAHLGDVVLDLGMMRHRVASARSTCAWASVRRSCRTRAARRRDTWPRSPSAPRRRCSDLERVRRRRIRPGTRARRGRPARTPGRARCPGSGWPASRACPTCR